MSTPEAEHEKLENGKSRSADAKSRSADLSPPDSVQRHDEIIEIGEIANDMEDDEDTGETPMEAGTVPFPLLGFLGFMT